MTISREESLSITLNNLYSAHQCCYIARVENTNPLNSGKLCEADYYICCLEDGTFFYTELKGFDLNRDR